MSVLCRIGWHRWLPWKEIRRGRLWNVERIASMVVDEYEIGVWVEQERTCARCGRMQMQTVTTR